MLAKGSGFVVSELIKLLCENKFNRLILLYLYLNKIKDYLV